MASNQIGHPSLESPQAPHEARPELRDSGQPRVNLEGVTATDVESIAYVCHELILAWRRAKGSFDLRPWSVMPGDYRNMIRHQALVTLQGTDVAPGALQMGYIERKLFKEVVRHLDPRGYLD